MAQEIAPYVNFQGKCQEALKFYQSAIGGELEMSKFGADGKLLPVEGPEDQVMHGVLKADGATIMASDGMPDFPPTVGDNVALALSGKDEAKLSAAFDKLAAGGNVKQPLTDAPWGDKFGFLEDKYGITWMIDVVKV